MLITFKCRACPDVVMLENLAQYLVGIIGKRLGERGVVAHDELGVAIAKLEAAITIDKQERAEHDGHFHEGEEGHEHHEIPPGLARRRRKTRISCGACDPGAISVTARGARCAADAGVPMKRAR
jgi:hypothetical protein